MYYSSFLGADASFTAAGSKSGNLKIYELGNGNRISRAPKAYNGAILSMRLGNHVYEAGWLLKGGADKCVR